MSNVTSDTTCPTNITQFPIQVWAYQPINVGTTIYGTNIGTTPYPGVSTGWYWFNQYQAYQFGVDGIVTAKINCLQNFT